MERVVHQVHLVPEATQEKMVYLDRKVHQDHLVRMVKEELQVLQALVVFKYAKYISIYFTYLKYRVFQVPQEIPVHQEKMVKVVHKAHLVLRGMLAHEVKGDFQENVVRWVNQDRQVLEGHLVRKDQMVYQ